MKKLRRSFCFVVFILALTSSLADAFSRFADNGRPNFLIIITDDQRYDTMDFMPRTKARIFDEGITFTNAYATTPLCCPSRSSILTGLYAHNHGVLNNNTVLQKKTFVEYLHENGYYTGLVGKYLNSVKGFPRPEFDFWVAHEYGSSRYFDPWLNVNGAWSVHSGYITFAFRDYALEFISRAEQQTKPFLLIFAPNAPHEPADPAPGDESLYHNLPPHRPPNFDEADVSDKPEWLQYRSPLTATPIAQIDVFRRRQLRSMHALDQAVDSLLTALTRQGKLDNTFVVYLSDNGYYWGEHRLKGKDFVYEEAIRVPFALRYPPLVQGPQVENKLVANIDIAPTLYELAGLPLLSEMDGRSLVSLLKTESNWRTDLLIEGWYTPLYPPFSAVHTEKVVYVENEGDRSEYYDLTIDPYQLKNGIDNSANAAVIDSLKKRLKQLRGTITSIEDFATQEPKGFYLLQNYPNPFNPTTTIRFSLPQRTLVTLKVFDALGKEVTILINKELNRGDHTVVFDTQSLPAGLYFYRLLTSRSSQTKSMLVLK